MNEIKMGWMKQEINEWMKTRKNNRWMKYKNGWMKKEIMNERTMGGWMNKIMNEIKMNEWTKILMKEWKSNIMSEWNIKMDEWKK